LRANLVADGANTLVFDFDSANFETGVGSFDLRVHTVPQSRGQYFSITNSDIPFSVVLPYRAFNTIYNDADFSDVLGITVGSSNGNLYGDFVLTGIRTAFYPDGDYNFDHRVDQLDYLIWRGQFGHPGPWPGRPNNPADGNRNGRVDAADYVIWRKNLGQPQASSTSEGSLAHLSVPEPAAGILLFGFGLVVWPAHIRASTSK
jgi:hypothetical protein